MNLPENWVKQIEFARLVKITPGAVTYIKKSFGDGCRGTKINLNHPAVIAYLEKKRAEETDPLFSGPQATPAPSGPQATPAPSGPQATPVTSSTNEAGLPEPPRPRNFKGKENDFRRYPSSELNKLTLEEIVQKFGTLPDFKNYVQTQIGLMDYEIKEAKRDTELGKVVGRNFVEKNVFGLLELLFKRLLKDAPIIIVPKILRIKEEGNVEEKSNMIKKEWGKVISQMIGDTKKQIADLI